MTTGDLPSAEERARERARAFTDLMWHAGAFVIINAMIWMLDLITGASGVQWAYWVTIFWGIGLAFHVLTYLIEDSGASERKYEEFLSEEQRRQDHGV